VSLSHKSPCTYLVQRSADEHFSTWPYSLVDCFFFFFIFSFLISTQHLLNVLIQIANKKEIKKSRVWKSKSKATSCYNWRSVSMSRYRAHSETCDQILLRTESNIWSQVISCDQILLSVRRLLSESCCPVSVERPLWREVGSVIWHSVYSNLSLLALTATNWSTLHCHLMNLCDFPETKSC
jgi:hypothetical protein